MTEKIRCHLLVSGRVQGVFFRNNTLKKALALSVTGWVRNLPDGRLEAVFEGEKDKVEEMVDWTRQGPAFAQVDDFRLSWEDYQGEFNTFKVR